MFRGHGCIRRPRMFQMVACPELPRRVAARSMRRAVACRTRSRRVRFAKMRVSGRRRPARWAAAASRSFLGAFLAMFNLPDIRKPAPRETISGRLPRRVICRKLSGNCQAYTIQPRRHAVDGAGRRPTADYRRLITDGRLVNPIFRRNRVRRPDFRIQDGGLLID